MTAQNLTWKGIPGTSSEDRDYHTSTLFKNYIITYGGKTSSVVLNSIKIFNLDRGCFEDFKLEGDKPSRRYAHSACLLSPNKIILFGGYDGEKVLHDTAMITIQDTIPLTLTYKTINTTGGTNLTRIDHSADIYQSKMYVFGGSHTENPVINNNQLWCLDLATFEWKICETTGEKPEARAHHLSAVYNNKLYIFGGYSEARSTGIESCSILPFERMKWENLKIEDVDFLQRNEASAVAIKDTLYIIGGFCGNELYNESKNEFVTYRFEGNTLHYLECRTNYLPETRGKVVAYKDNLIYWGEMKRMDKEQDEDEEDCKLFSLQLNRLCGSKSQNFSDYMGRLFGSEEYSDVRFSIQGQEIPAHKNVLAVRCKYFSNLFKSGMKESSSSIIQVKNVKPDTFKALLGFLYQNEIELTVSLALDLYGLADEYMQTELTGLCEKFLARNITLDNLMTIVDLVQKFGANSLKKSILSFIANNIEKLMENQTYYLLPCIYIWEIAAKLRKALKSQKNPK